MNIQKEVKSVGGAITKDASSDLAILLFQRVSSVPDTEELRKGAGGGGHPSNPWSELRHKKNKRKKRAE